MIRYSISSQTLALCSARSLFRRHKLTGSTSRFYLVVAVLGALGVSMLLSSSVAAQNPNVSPAGNWQGVLHVNLQQLHLALHITAADNGKLSGTVDSLDQGAKGIPADTVSLQGSQISITLPVIKATYEGKLTQDSSEIVGTWSQGGARFPLTWSRSTQPAATRVQEPRPPFPYESYEVQVDNEAANLHLAGTLTKPTGPGPFPALLLITGSGPQDRDETIFGHRPFFVISDFLTRHGLAVLRLDDRGTASSSGSFKGATTADFVTDALAAVTFLAKRNDINHEEIGLLGHSEGGIIAPLVAVESPVVSFIILLAGPGVPGGVLLPEQAYRTSLAEGQSDAEARNRAVHVAAFLDAFDRGGTSEKAVALMLDSSPTPDAALKERLQAEAAVYATPWFRHFVHYDPYPTLQRVNCPVLALIGDHDVQVPASLNIPFLRSATAWNRRSLVSTEPGLNHLFQQSRTGSPMEYAEIAETVAPSVLQTIYNWINLQLSH